jgi:hypothetical protein
MMEMFDNVVEAEVQFLMESFMSCDTSHPTITLAAVLHFLFLKVCLRFKELLLFSSID